MNKTLLLEALRAVLYDAENGTIKYKYVGICCNVVLNAPYGIGSAERVYRRLDEIFKGWPEHSGSESRPVASSRYDVISGDWRWEGEQLQARIRLLQYSIAKLTAEINDCGAVANV